MSAPRLIPSQIGNFQWFSERTDQEAAYKRLETFCQSLSLLFLLHPSAGRITRASEDSSEAVSLLVENYGIDRISWSPDQLGIFRTLFAAYAVPKSFH